MSTAMRELLKSGAVKASAPCRIDMGGTLDLSTFFLPLRFVRPCTFNIALALRTTVVLEPWEKERIRISSRGFEDAEFYAGQAPFNHPLGFMFAVANYFGAAGVRITIDSSSPPRSALGGSSAAAVALVAAFGAALRRAGRGGSITRRRAALLAHALESSVAGVPCGLQDHLAAAYGGVNAWYWPENIGAPDFRRVSVKPPGKAEKLKDHILVAYCGVPHTSADINGEWVRQFIAGTDRNKWVQVAECTHGFVEALSTGDYKEAAACMNREVALRTAMTPEVLDGVGRQLVEGAVNAGCGSRFTGAGGGGCVWALGDVEDIDRLRQIWEKALSTRADARLLDAAVDRTGMKVTSSSRAGLRGA
ncbi:MAG: galactokinase [Deltaproteobacteria bacterium]|jgi:D-glycero-alpha-D-manno-heptose-7-phosphate kinase|nr:galactokinase [Deltaproteobacteria bacterium]